MGARKEIERHDGVRVETGTREQVEVPRKCAGAATEVSDPLGPQFERQCIKHLAFEPGAWRIDVTDTRHGTGRMPPLTHLRQSLHASAAQDVCQWRITPRALDRAAGQLDAQSVRPCTGPLAQCGAYAAVEVEHR